MCINYLKQVIFKNNNYTFIASLLYAMHCTKNLIAFFHLILTTFHYSHFSDEETEVMH